MIGERRAGVVSASMQAAVRAYQLLVSPLLPPSCRFLPSCSDYAIEAFERHGALRGSGLALRRLAHCHPWGGSGYDPVPPLPGGKPSDRRHARATS
ncbi:MAG: membrane protein insertion efficiency factor YidD [Stellaceae bacterium]